MNFNFNQLFEVGNIVIFENNNICDVRNDGGWDKSYWLAGYSNNNVAKNGNKIKMIIEPDYVHGTVKVVFNRETDILKSMPKPKTGMFVEVKTCIGDTVIGVVVNDKILYKEGTYGTVSNMWDDKNNNANFIMKIIESPYGFNSLNKYGTVIWERN